MMSKKEYGQIFKYETKIDFKKINTYNDFDLLVQYRDKYLIIIISIPTGESLDFLNNDNHGMFRRNEIHDKYDNIIQYKTFDINKIDNYIYDLSCIFKK